MSIFNFALFHRWVMVTWQGRASLWRMWPSFPSSPMSSITGMLTWGSEKWLVSIGKNEKEKFVKELTLWSWLFCLPSSSPSSSPQCEARYPNMAAYYNRLKDRPSIKATWPPARFENPEGMEYIKDCWNDCTTTATTIATTTTAARITSYSCKPAAYCNWLGAWDLKKVLVSCANPIKPTLSFPRIVNFTFSIYKVLF